jgi:hypothetical protein
MTESHRHRRWNEEIQVPSARRPNLFAAQQRRGEFGWLAQDDKVLCFSELSWSLYIDTVFTGSHICQNQADVGHPPQGISTDSHRHPSLNFEGEERNAGAFGSEMQVLRLAA